MRTVLALALALAVAPAIGCGSGDDAADPFAAGGDYGLRPVDAEVESDEDPSTGSPDAIATDAPDATSDAFADVPIDQSADSSESGIDATDASSDVASATPEASVDASDAPASDVADAGDDEATACVSGACHYFGQHHDCGEFNFCGTGPFDCGTCAELCYSGDCHSFADDCVGPWTATDQAHPWLVQLKTGKIGCPQTYGCAPAQWILDLCVQAPPPTVAPAYWCDTAALHSTITCP